MIRLPRTIRELLVGYPADQKFLILKDKNWHLVSFNKERRLFYNSYLTIGDDYQDLLIYLLPKLD